MCTLSVGTCIETGVTMRGITWNLISKDFLILIDEGHGICELKMIVRNELRAQRRCKGGNCSNGNSHH